MGKVLFIGSMYIVAGLWLSFNPLEMNRLDCICGCSRANIEREITDADAAELLLTIEQHSRRVIERLGMNDCDGNA